MQRTREALLEAALAMFADHGLDVSLDAICDHAGFTRGAFYVHFADREALLVAVMDHVGRTFLGSVFAGATDGGAGDASTGAVRAVIERFLTAVEGGTYPLLSRRGARPAVPMSQLLEACGRSVAVRARYAALVDASISALEGLVKRDQAAGVLREGASGEDLAKLLLAIIVGAQTMAEIGVSIDASRLAGAVLALVEGDP